ncbi:MAG: cytochrome c [Gammaproteobacteria bacterium]|nr:cytochrome c [Gammaproteobacteria bacterium]MBT4494926.1 cytochrome c [Gammaproteobacteria bacterium]MBT7370714.1 cytochrome c [Gammaproteobacteria bacterium]
MVRVFMLFFALSLVTDAIASDSETTYKFYCAQCHGVNGDGTGPNVTADFATDPRNFTKKEDMAKLSDADIRSVILDGGPALSKSALMPPWSKTLTSEEVDGLVQVLRGFCNCQGAP